MTDDRVTRLQKVVTKRGDGWFEAVVRVCFEDGTRREFIAGACGDPFEAANMAVALERKLCPPRTAGSRRPSAPSRTVAS